MNEKKRTGRALAASILSLSLLTVMAGAAVAPALGVIREAFAGESQILIQMIISVPALFIFAANLIFPKLCARMGSRSLVLTGLLLYTFGGVMAGVFSNIWPLLAMRAVVGIGVGIIMPLSTGLLAYYFPAGRLDRMMGASSAMNQIGGVIATLLSGILAAVSWRASFLVYLMGLISIVLCLVFLPDDRIQSENAESSAGENLRKYSPYIAAMFFLMMSFFIYPSNFAMVSTADGSVPQNLIAVIMAGMDVIAAAGGVLFVKIKEKTGESVRLLAPALFLLGYLLLAARTDLFFIMLGSACIGFANGLGIPFIIAAASRKAGKTAAATALPLISASLYLSQFLTPFVYSAVKTLPGLESLPHLPYYMGICTSLIFLIWSALLLREGDFQEKKGETFREIRQAGPQTEN